MNDVEVSPMNRQKILRKLAIAFSSPDYERYSFLIQSLDDVHSLFEIDVFKQIYEEKSIIAYEKIKKFKYDVSILESYRIGLSQKTIDENDVTSIRFRKYLTSMKNIVKNYYYITKILSDLLKLTTLKNSTIPKNYWEDARLRDKRLIPPKKRDAYPSAPIEEEIEV